MSAAFLSPLLDMLNMLPAGALGLVAMRGCLRMPFRRAAVILAAVMAVYIPGTAALCAFTGIGASWVRLFSMPFFLVVNRVLSTLSLGKSALCVLSFVMLGTFTASYQRIVMAAVSVPAGFPASNLISLGIFVLLCAFFAPPLTVWFPKTFREPVVRKVWWWFWTIPAFMAASFVYLMTLTPAELPAGRVRLSFLMFMPCNLVAVWLFYLFFYRISFVFVSAARLERANSLLRAEQRRYEEQRDFLRESRRVRHDFRQHLRVIAGLSRAGNLEKLNSYLDEYLVLADARTPMLCQNAAVDAIAGSYEARARELGAVIRWRLDLPEKLPVDEVDLCMILGNLVENALNAVEELEEGGRTVHVTAAMPAETMLAVTVENPCRPGARPPETVWRLGEDPTAAHGLGLTSVNAVVQSYGGHFTVDAANGSFTASVLLYTK